MPAEPTMKRNAKPTKRTTASVAVLTKLKLTISPTSSGEGVYLQVMSDDMKVNVVLIADSIEVTDAR